MYHFLLGNKKI